MRFELTAKPTKQIWTNNESWLYEVTEIGEKQNRWSIFTRQELNPQSTYLISGYCGHGKSKKLDANNKPIWQINFNAEEIKEESSEEINF